MDYHPNDPEKKNLNLEIFSTDIVEYISIDKVLRSYMETLLVTLTLFQKTIKEMDFKD
jgi:hypothetical protein